MPWLPKQTVVVPFDFSDESLGALDTALNFVDDATHLHVIHVLPVLIATEPGVIWENLEDRTRCEHAIKGLRERFTAAKYAGVQVEARVGDPGHEIAKFAEDLKAELIVMPSHGRTGLKHLLIGSVAERVVRLAHCPVLVLRK